MGIHFHLLLFHIAMVYRWPIYLQLIYDGLPIEHDDSFIATVEPEAFQAMTCSYIFNGMKMLFCRLVQANRVVQDIN